MVKKIHQSVDNDLRQYGQIVPSYPALDNVITSLTEKVSLTHKIKIIGIDTANGGDSTLIIFPDGKTMLIDALLSSEVSNVVSTLTANNITNLDYCMLSHYHDDHVGGFLSGSLNSFINGNTTFILPQNLPTSALLTENQNQSETNLKALIKQRGCKINQPTEEKSVLTIEDGIYGEFYNVDHSSYYSDAVFNYNNCSLCFKLYNQKASAFFSGDIATSAQNKLIGKIGHVEIYKAHHHGSDTFQNGQYLLELSPSVIYACTSSASFEQYSASRSFTALVTQYGYSLVQTGINGNVTLELEQYKGYSVNAKATESYSTITSIDILLKTSIYNESQPSLTLQGLVDKIPFNTGFQFALLTSRFPNVLGGSYTSSSYFFSGWKTYNNWYFITVTDLVTLDTFYIQVKNGVPSIVNTQDKYFWFDTGNINANSTLSTFASNDNKYGVTVNGGTITGLTGYNKLELYLGIYATSPQNVPVTIFGTQYYFYTQGGSVTFRMSLVIPRVAFSIATPYTIKNDSTSATVSIQGRITKLLV